MSLLRTLAGITGAAIGFFLGGVKGAFWGYQIGSSIGQAVDPGAALTTEQAGQRLSTNYTSTSGYGAYIPKIKGQMVVPGKYIAATEIRERRHINRTVIPGGKKQPDTIVTQKTFTYDLNCVIALCEGEADVLKVWFDGNLLVDFTEGNSGIESVLGKGSRYRRLRCYRGTETQGINGTYVDIVGENYASALRGICYLVIRRLDVTDLGGRPPNITALVSDNSVVGSAVADQFSIIIPNGDTLYVTAEGTSFTVGYFAGVGPNGSEFRYTWMPGHVDSSGGGNMYFFVSDGANAFDFLKVSESFGTGYNLSTKRGQLNYTIEDNDYFANASGTATFNKCVSFEGRGVIAKCLLDSSGGTHKFGNNLWFIEWGEFIDRLIPFDTTGITGWSTNDDAYGVAIYGNNLYINITGTYRWIVHINLTTSVQTTILNGDTEQITSNTGMLVDVDDTHFYVMYYSAVAASWHIKSFLHGSATVIWDYDIASWGSGDPTSQLWVSGEYAYFRYTNLGVNYIRQLTIDGTDPATGSNTTLTTASFATVPEISGNIQFGSDGRTYALQVPHSDASSNRTLYWVEFGLTLSSDLGLDDYVGMLCERAGMSASDYDVTDIASITCKGFGVMQRMSARKAIDQLQIIYGFASRDNDGVMEFIDLRSPTEFNITVDDLASNINKSDDVTLKFKQKSEVELPKELTFGFIDPSRDYEPNVVSIVNPVINSERVMELSAPIVMSSTEAAERVDAMMTTVHGSNWDYQFSVSKKIGNLLPGDVVNVTVDSIAHSILVTNVSWGINLDITGISYKAGLLDNTISIADSGQGQVVPISKFSGITTFEIIDTPPIRDVDSIPGVYIAAQGLSAGWIGASFLQSIDAGETFQEITQLVTETDIGYATTILADGPTEIWDTGNTVTIRFKTAAQSLTSATRAAVLNNANVMMLGDELIAYTTVVDNGDNSFTISELLRGLKGTENFTSTHAITERAVVITDENGVSSTQGIAHVGLPLEQLNLLTKWLGVSFNNIIDTTAAKDFTWSGNSAKEYKVVHVKGFRLSGTDLTVTWTPQERLDHGLRDYVDRSTPSGDLWQYQIDVMNGATVLNTYTIDDADTWTYTATEQSSDSVPDADNIELNIYKMNNEVGRGFVTNVTL